MNSKLRQLFNPINFYGLSLLTFMHLTTFKRRHREICVDSEWEGKTAWNYLVSFSRHQTLSSQLHTTNTNRTLLHTLISAEQILIPYGSLICKKRAVPRLLKIPFFREKRIHLFLLAICLFCTEVSVCSVHDQKSTYRYKKSHKFFNREYFFLVPPEWVTKPADQEVIEGQDVSFPCQVSGVPKPNVVWKKLSGDHLFLTYNSRRNAID